MTLKQKLIVGGVGLALGAGLFFTGRYSNPSKVEIREVVVEKTVIIERVDEKKLEALTLEIRTQRAEMSQLKKSIHKEKKSMTYPDGRVEASETVDINIEKTVQKTVIQEVIKEVVVIQEKIVDRVVNKTVIVETEKIVNTARPGWRLGPMVGVDATNLATGFTKNLAFGAHAERRLPLIDAFWVGAYGLSNGNAGLSLSLEF